MVYPADEETFDERVSPEFVRDDHLNLIQAFLKRLQDFLGYGGRISDKFGIIVPPGVMFEWPDVAAPSGFLLCDGKQYDGAHSDYADLYAEIGKKYGGGAGSLFHVPDRRGYFTRGYSKIPTISFVPGSVSIEAESIALSGQKFHRTGFPVRFTTDDTLPAPLVINTTYYLHWAGAETFHICTSRANAFAVVVINLTTVGVGTSYCHPYVEEDKDSRLKLAEGGNDGEDLGSYQEDAFQKHYHKILDDIDRGVWRSAVMELGAFMTAYLKVGWTAESYNAKDVYSDGSFPTPRETVESRPRNVNVNYIIKR